MMVANASSAQPMLTLYFCQHGKEDTPALRQIMPLATILGYEHAYHGEDDARIKKELNKLSRGIVKPRQLLKRFPTGDASSVLPYLRLIHRSKLQVVLESSPCTHEDIQRFEELSFVDPDETLPISAQAQQLKSIFEEQAEYNRRRDEALAHQLKGLVVQNLSARILVVRGQGHRYSLQAECSKAELTYDVAFGGLHPSAQFEVVALIAGGRQPTQQQLNKALQERMSNIRTV
jgi:hypothetical protein